MTIEWWFGYLLTTVVLSLSPGSGALNTMSTAIGYGYRGALVSVAGLQSGLVLQILLVGAGLGTLFAHSALAFTLLKWFGAVWLVWLGVQQWRTAGAIHVQVLAQHLPRRRLFTRAMLVNVSNPKSLVFLAALFPQFIVPNQPQAVQYLVLGGTSVLVDIMVMAGYARLARHIGGWLKEPRQMKILNRLFGTLFMVIGILLATTRRN